MSRVVNLMVALIFTGLWTAIPPAWSQTSSPVFDKEGAVRADAPLTMSHSQIQEQLKENGFDPGPIDGIVGPKTHSALKSFQSANNLKTTGNIDIETAQALGVDIPRNVRLSR